jgi:phosphoserine phosphatase
MPNVPRISQTDSSQTAAVFDVCDTLFFSNTTHDFVKFVVAREGGTRWLIHNIFNSRFSPFRYFFIGLSVFAGWDYLRKFNLRLLSGRSKEELDGLSNKFVGEFLHDRKITAIHALLNKSLSNGDRVVLCSSSIEPVVAAVAAKLKVKEYVSTTLEYENGVFSGFIADDVSNTKLTHLRKNGVECEIGLAVSDNISDLDLLKAARRSYAVAYSNRKKDFWRKCNIETLDPYS